MVGSRKTPSPPTYQCFLYNPYKNEAMVTFLIDVPDFSTFSHMTTSTILTDSGVKLLRGPRVANFPDIIKISTMFIKKTFKDSKKLKELQIMD